MRCSPLLLGLLAAAVGCKEPASATRSDAEAPLVASRTAPAGATVAASAATAARASAAASGTADASTGRATQQDDWIERHLRAADPRFDRWLAKAEEYRLQILVTIVAPGPHGAVRFEEHDFRVDAEYVYPASAIKTFLAVAVLRTLTALAQRHQTKVDASARILRCREDRAGCKPPPADEDKDDDDDDPDHAKLRVGQEIHKLLSYSDNESYDRLYDIVGHRELNEQMAAMGFSSVRFHHRMNAPASRSKRMRRVILVPRGGRAIDLPRRKSDFEPPPTPAKELSIGTAHFGERGRVDEPMSFAAKNYASLRDMQRLNISLLFPTSERALDLGLSDEQRALIVDAMTGKVRHTRHAADHKPLLPGVLEVLPAERIRYVGKSGRAYGFHLENAYIEDTSTKRGMLVTVSIYVNPNGVLNDDDYGYEETSRPFLRVLGQALTRVVLASAEQDR